MPGGMLTLSADGSTPGTGVVGTNPDGSKSLQLLWDSSRLPDNSFNHAKFCLPVVWDGKVFVPTYDGRVDVYGP